MCSSAPDVRVSSTFTPSSSSVTVFSIDSVILSSPIVVSLVECEGFTQVRVVLIEECHEFRRSSCDAGFHVEFVRPVVDVLDPFVVEYDNEPVARLNLSFEFVT